MEFNLDERLTFFESAVLRVEEGVFRRAMTPEQVAMAAIDGLASALYRNQPDVLLVVSGFFVDLRILHYARAHGTKVVVMNTESPYEETRQMMTADHADLVVLNDPTNLEQYRQVTRAMYLPHAYRPHVHHPGPASPDLKCDFGFVGTGYRSRIDFFEAMSLDGLDVVLAGNWQQLEDSSPLAPFLVGEKRECYDNEDTADLYRSAKVGLNLYRREANVDDGDTAHGWAMGPREVEMAACGLFFLRDPRGEGDEVLPMLPTFTDPGDAGEQMRWWLAHDDERQAVAAKAREAVADRTFEANARALLAELS